MRLGALILAIALLTSILSGCGLEGYKELGEMYGITDSANTDTNGKNNSSNDDVQAQIDAINQQLTQALASIEEVKAENASLKAEIETVSNENEALEAENLAYEEMIANLQAQIEALKAQSSPKVEVINGVVYCDVEYFLERATVHFDDGTAALKAIEDGTAIVLDDVHAIAESAKYRDDSFELPRKGYNIAVTFDGKNVYLADFSNYHWATGSLWLKETTNTGYALKETKKHSSLGWFDSILQGVAVCVPNENAEYGYDFYVAAGFHGANPEIKDETKVVEKCGRCDHLIDECICKPETEYVDKCGRCDKLINECVCKPETEYVDKCGRCNHLLSECICVPEVETKTEYIVIEKPVVEKVEYCGRCNHLLTECICKNEPAHNERPTDDDSTQNPESDGTVVETPAHNPRPGMEDSTQNPESNGTVVETPAHNPRPTEDDSTKQEESDSNVPTHNSRSTTSNTANSNTDSTLRVEGGDIEVEGPNTSASSGPAHSPRP